MLTICNIQGGIKYGIMQIRHLSSDYSQCDKADTLKTVLIKW